MGSSVNRLVKMKRPSTTLLCPATGWRIHGEEPKLTPDTYSERIANWIKEGALIIVDAASDAIESAEQAEIEAKEAREKADNAIKDAKNAEAEALAAEEDEKALKLAADADVKKQAAELETEKRTVIDDLLDAHYAMMTRAALVNLIEKINQADETADIDTIDKDLVMLREDITKWGDSVRERRASADEDGGDNGEGGGSGSTEAN